jgi:hypothetical protein
MTHPLTPAAQYTDQSLSAIFHALRAPRRRLTVVLIAGGTARREQTGDGSSGGILRDSEASVIPVRELAREIVAIEQDIPRKNATGKDYHGVYTALIQTHLPLLDEMDVIDYDENRKTVKRSENLAVVTLVASICSPTVQLMFRTPSATVDDES